MAGNYPVLEENPWKYQELRQKNNWVTTFQGDKVKKKIKHKIFIKIKKLIKEKETMNYRNKQLMNDYVKYETGAIAYREERRLVEELTLFFEFVEEQEINLKELPELKELDKSHLVEYFILLREKKEDSDEAISKHIRTIQRFLNYLRGVGYIKLKGRDSDDRVKEAPGLYVCA